jgi:hypothetical protein
MDMQPSTTVVKRTQAVIKGTAAMPTRKKASAQNSRVIGGILASP